MSSERRRLVRKYEAMQDAMSIAEQLRCASHALEKLKVQRRVTLDLIQKLRAAVDVFREDEMEQFTELADEFCTLFGF